MRTLLLVAGLLALLGTPAPAQLPPTPLVWLRADSGVVRSGDTVTRWRDMSGRGNDALPAAAAQRPSFAPTTFNGKPGVRFSGGQMLRCPDVFPTTKDYTKIIVVRINNYGAVNNLLSGSFGHALFYGGGAHVMMFHAGTFATAYSASGSTPTLLSATFSQPDLYGRIYVDGVFDAGGYTSTPNADSTLYVGAFAGGYEMNGDVAEAIVYDRALTEQERTTTEIYLAAKYGITLRTTRRPFPFAQFPAPLQFYPRGADDSASVPVAGAVTAPGFDSVRADIYRDGGYWRSVAQELSYETDTAYFRLEPRIYARPVEFGLRVYLVRDGRDSLIGARDSIVCGDVLLVMGQSNSTPGNGLVTYTNEFCRTFGVNSGYGRYEPSDTIWGFSAASNGGFQGRWHVGVWGLRIQQLLLERRGMPTCVITGGVSGSSIELNLRNDANPADLTTIYGRGRYRIGHAGLSGSARALFWYQGESNGITNYYANFKRLYDAWREDYPNVERFYVVQIRPGCAGDAPTHPQLRELLRTLPDSLPRITGYAPTGAPGHDGCHYTAEGYFTIAAQLYKLLARDLYGDEDSIEIASPNIERAYWASARHDEIVLRFQDDQRPQWPADFTAATGTYRMADQFFLDGAPAAIDGGIAERNTIRLRLSTASNATRIGYIPAQTYAGTATIYEGPWILNRRGVGAFTFWDQPIQASASGVALDAADDDPDGILSLAPMPLSASGSVRVRLREAGAVRLALVDALGRRVREWDHDILEAGVHELSIDASGIPPGLYHVTMLCRGEAYNTPALVVR